MFEYGLVVKFASNKWRLKPRGSQRDWREWDGRNPPGRCGNAIQGNSIGVSAYASNIGNQGSGILFAGALTANSFIGGFNPGEGNTIAFNLGAGSIARPIRTMRPTSTTGSQAIGSMPTTAWALTWASRA